MYKAKMHFKIDGTKVVIPLIGDTEDGIEKKIDAIRNILNLKYSCTVWE